MVGLAVAAFAAGAVVAWGYSNLRWGCPSYAEANRPRTPTEVAAAFGDNGLPIVPVQRDAVPNATVFRHAATGATVWVVVCATNACASDVTRLLGDRRPTRRGLNLLNVRILLTAADPRAAAGLVARTNAAASALSSSTRDKRCFPD